jgi:Helix-turn-helix domain
VTLPELLQDLERRAREAEAIGASAPLATVYRQLVGDLRQLDAADVAVSYDANGAAHLLGVSPKTVANWCAAGKFAGARKTGGAGGGKWVVPATAVRAFQHGGQAA